MNDEPSYHTRCYVPVCQALPAHCEGCGRPWPCPDAREALLGPDRGV